MYQTVEQNNDKTIYNSEQNKDKTIDNSEPSWSFMEQKNDQKGRTYFYHKLWRNINTIKNTFFLALQTMSTLQNFKSEIAVSWR